MSRRREERPRISADEMEREHIARFAELEPSPVAYVDTLIPEHARETFNVIGRGVTENAALEPAIPHAEQFNVSYIRCAPGKGAALHSHPTIEVFFIMEGRFTVYWGEKGESRVELGPWDMISIPPGVWRGFYNSGEGTAYLMAIFGGTDAGHVDWPGEVLAKARATGMELDDDGNIVSMPAWAKEKFVTPG